MAQRGKLQEEHLEKYKVEEAKKDAYKGRGEPLEWRIVKKEVSTSKVGRRLLGQNFLLIQRKSSMQARRNNTKRKDNCHKR